MAHSKKYADLNINALLDLRDDIEVRLHNLRDMLVSHLEALGGDHAKLERLARTGRPHGLTGRKIAAKYKDPETGATWAGRGAVPRWLAAYEAEGRHREEFAIEPTPTCDARKKHGS
jgi:DNA-binding protein H-NS